MISRFMIVYQGRINEDRGPTPMGMRVFYVYAENHRIARERFRRSSAPATAFSVMLMTRQVQQIPHQDHRPSGYGSVVRG